MKTLIINLGPPGDVLRTTTLLGGLKGEVYWLTSKKSKDILKSKKISKILFIEDKKDLELMEKIQFDRVISLNEEKEILNKVKLVKTKRLIGVYLDKDNQVKYTPESSYWFDMSLSSRFGKEKADELKWKNKKSVPQILIEMIGKKWSGQEYFFGPGYNKKEIKGRIGLVDVETGLWPNKLWAGYAELAKLLKKEGYEVIFLGMRPTMEEHIKELMSCEVIISGDNLPIHLALALKKKVITLFTCTSPHEIYGYGRMTKVISPKLKEFFYQKKYDKRATKAISTEGVLFAVKKLLKV